jgi:hypothetical protein
MADVLIGFQQSTFFQAELRIQFISCPIQFLGFSNPGKGAPKQEISKWSTICIMFLRSGWSIIRSASLAKGGTSKKRLSLHLHKVLTWSNKVSPWTLQTAPIYCIVARRPWLEFMFTVFWDCDGLLLLRFMPQKAVKALYGTAKHKHRNADRGSSYPWKCHCPLVIGSSGQCVRLCLLETKSSILQYGSVLRWLFPFQTCKKFLHRKFFFNSDKMRGAVSACFKAWKLCSYSEDVKSLKLTSHCITLKGNCVEYNVVNR